MKKSVVASVSIGIVLVIAVVVVLLVRAGGDGEDATNDPRRVDPTASASEPVVAPSPAPSTDGSSSTPAGGTVSTPRPTAPPEPSKPVDIGDVAAIDAGAKAQIVTIKSVTSEAESPGEISGPAIQVTIQISAGSKDVSLADVVVNGYYGSDVTPAIPVAKPGGRPFAGTLSGGEKTTGVYVFNVPAADRDDVTIELFFSASQAPVLFTGSAR